MSQSNDLWTRSDNPPRLLTLEQLSWLTGIAEENRQKYARCPVAILASEKAIDHMRTTFGRDQPEPSMISGLRGPDLGIPVYLDRRLEPGTWRFAYIWKDVEEVLTDDEQGGVLN